MKNLAFKVTMLLPITLFIVGLSGCEEEQNEITAAKVKIFDIELFKANVDAFMQGNATGYCYVIAQDGQVVFMEEVGERIAGADGSLGQDVQATMYTASVSKAITAIAALKLIDSEDISINDKIWNYLPSHWTIANSFKQISFKNLLQHKSGIDKSTGFDYSSLKTLAANGISIGDIDVKSEYANANFGLFRILIPYMISDQDGFVGAGYTLDDGINFITASVYRNYVKDNLFTPLNINYADTQPLGPIPTLYYSYPAGNGEAGWNIGNRILLAGGGGWYISCYDLARFFAYVRFTEDVISDGTRQLMDDNYLGWDRGLSVSENYEHGIYHAKNGGFTNGDGQGVSTLIKNFPEGVQITVMINSVGGDYGGLSINSGVATAFDNAWVEQ
jgi:D-alanyl-D-alanine carboxypeptidase